MLIEILRVVSLVTAGAFLILAVLWFDEKQIKLGIAHILLCMWCLSNGLM